MWHQKKFLYFTYIGADITRLKGLLRSVNLVFRQRLLASAMLVQMVKTKKLFDFS
jgi:hypothetical protein